MIQVSNEDMKLIIECISDYIGGTKPQDIRQFNRIRRSKLLLRKLNKKL